MENQPIIIKETKAYSIDIGHDRHFEITKIIEHFFSEHEMEMPTIIPPRCRKPLNQHDIAYMLSWEIRRCLADPRPLPVQHVEARSG